MRNAINAEPVALAKKSRESMSLKNLIKQSWGSDLFQETSAAAARRRSKS